MDRRSAQRRRRRKRGSIKNEVSLYLIKTVLILIVMFLAGFTVCKTGAMLFQKLNNFYLKETAQDSKTEAIEVRHSVIKENHFSTVEEPELNAALQELAGQDERVWDILEHSSDYPEEYLLMISRNPETIEFVLGYQSLKEQPVPETIGEVAKGSIPHLLQWDARWGHTPYGTSTIAVSGCGPTSLAMVIAGLTGDASVTPYTLARYSEENSLIDEENNTVWDLLSRGAANWGLQVSELYPEQSEVFSQLQAGHPIICSMKPGDFTAVGHFIVLIAVEDGKIRVYDPNSMERSVRLWDYEILEPQILSMWAYTLLS